MVTSPLPLAANAGQCFATLSSGRIFPCSMSIIIDVPVAIGLVSEARSKIASAVIGNLSGSTARFP